MKRIPFIEFFSDLNEKDLRLTNKLRIISSQACVTHKLCTGNPSYEEFLNKLSEFRQSIGIFDSGVPRLSLKMVSSFDLDYRLYSIECSLKESSGRHTLVVL